MAWFPRELIDAVTRCTLHSRVIDLGTKITLHIVTMQHLIKNWIPLQEVQLQENPWQELLIFFVDDLFGTEMVELT